jgi:hypothetical protein
VECNHVSYEIYRSPLFWNFHIFIKLIPLLRLVIIKLFKRSCNIYTFFFVAKRITKQSFVQSFNLLIVEVTEIAYSEGLQPKEMEALVKEFVAIDLNKLSEYNPGS